MLVKNEAPLENIHKDVFGEDFPREDFARRVSSSAEAYCFRTAEGYAVVFGNGDEAYLWLLGVSPKHRGIGAGGRLLEEIETTVAGRYSWLNVKTYHKWGAMVGMLHSRNYKEVGRKWSEKRNAEQLMFRKELR